MRATEATFSSSVLARLEYPLPGQELSLSMHTPPHPKSPRRDPETRLTRALGNDPVNASERGRFLSVQLRKRWLEPGYCPLRLGGRHCPREDNGGPGCAG